MQPMRFKGSHSRTSTTRTSTITARCAKGSRKSFLEKGNLPRVVKPFVSKEILVWIDHATWRQAEHTCDWWFGFPAFEQGGISCRGHNWFEATQRGCRLVITGALTIDLSKIKGVPRLARGLGPRVEKYILGRVRPNLEATAQALEKMIGDAGDNR